MLSMMEGTEHRTPEQIAQWFKDVDQEKAAQQAFMAAWKKVPRYARLVARDLGHEDEQTAADLVAAHTDFTLALEMIGKACARFLLCLEAVRPADGRPITIADLVADPNNYGLSSAYDTLQGLCLDYADVCDAAFWQAYQIIDPDCADKPKLQMVPPPDLPPAS